MAKATPKKARIKKNFSVLKETKWQRIDKKKLRFLVAGGLNTVVGLAAYPFFYWLAIPYKIHYLLILTVTQVFCVTFSYVTNKWLVFRTQGNYLREYLKFTVFHLTYFVINLMALPTMVEFGRINPVIAQSVFAVLVIISSYVWHSRITFRQRG